MAFVRALSAMPKVPPLRVIPFLASGLEACRVLSSLLRARIVRPASVLRVDLADVPGKGATRGEVGVPLLVVLLPTPALPRRCDMPLFFDLSAMVLAARPEETYSDATVREPAAGLVTVRSEADFPSLAGLEGLLGGAGRLRGLVFTRLTTLERVDLSVLLSAPGFLMPSGADAGLVSEPPTAFFPAVGTDRVGATVLAAGRTGDRLRAADG